MGEVEGVNGGVNSGDSGFSSASAAAQHTVRSRRFRISIFYTGKVFVFGWIIEIRKCSTSVREGGDGFGNMFDQDTVPDFQEETWHLEITMIFLSPLIIIGRFDFLKYIILLYI